MQRTYSLGDVTTSLAAGLLIVMALVAIGSTLDPKSYHIEFDVAIPVAAFLLIFVRVHDWLKRRR